MAGLTGKLEVTVHSGKELHNVNLLIAMSPYVELRTEKEKFETRAHHHGGKNPTWDESYIFNLEGKEDVLRFIVKSKEEIHDQTVGTLAIPLRNLANCTKQEFEILHDDKRHGFIVLSIKYTGKDAGGTLLAGQTQTAAAPAAAAPVFVQQPVYVQQPQVVYQQPVQPVQQVTQQLANVVFENKSLPQFPLSDAQSGSEKVHIHTEGKRTLRIRDDFGVDPEGADGNLTHLHLRKHEDGRYQIRREENQWLRIHDGHQVDGHGVHNGPYTFFKIVAKGNGVAFLFTQTNEYLAFEGTKPYGSNSEANAAVFIIKPRE